MTYYPSTMNDGDHVFVFGSNLRGRHGAGTALEAATRWGAKEGRCRGRTGQSFAIPTKDTNLRTLPLADIQWGVDALVTYATEHHELMFLVTAVGCGFAGYRSHDIASMFIGVPDNCVLPNEWAAIIKRLVTKSTHTYASVRD